MKGRKEEMGVSQLLAKAAVEKGSDASDSGNGGEEDELLWRSL